jgi:iron(III) transport system permease protein
MIADMASLGLILVVLAAFALAAAQALNGEATPLHGDAASPIGMCPLGRWQFSSELALIFLLFMAAFVPVAALVWAALTPAPGVALTFNTITSANFIDVFGSVAGAPLRAIGNSFLFSSLAALICAFLALICVFAFGRLKPRTRALVELLSDWPFAMPGIVLAVTFILLFLKPLPLINVSLYGTAIIIILAYVARFFVLTLKPALAALDASDPTIEEAALLCGAGRYALIRYILLPAIGPALFSGAIIIFLTAFNELTVSALLWGPGTQTLGVVMFGYEEAGLSGQAAVLGLTGLAVGAIAVWVIDRLRHYCPPGAIPWR